MDASAGHPVSSGLPAPAQTCGSSLGLQQRHPGARPPTVDIGFGLGAAEAPALSPGEHGNRANGVSRSQSGETCEQAGWGQGRHCP